MLCETKLNTIPCCWQAKYRVKGGIVADHLTCERHMRGWVELDPRCVVTRLDGSLVIDQAWTEEVGNVIRELFPDATE